MSKCFKGKEKYILNYVTFMHIINRILTFEFRGPSYQDSLYERTSKVLKTILALSLIFPLNLQLGQLGNSLCMLCRPAYAFGFVCN